MKPTLEPAGNLLVPVDDSGTAVGRPTIVLDGSGPNHCPECGNPVWGKPDAEGLVDCTGPCGCGVWFRPGGTSDDLQGLAEDAARAEDLRHALERLAREAQMFRDYGHGREHLTNALIDAKRVLEGGAL